MKRTYTFNWFTFWPRWRSYHFTPKPVNWLLFKWYDFALLVVGLVLAAVFSPWDWLATALAVWYFLVFPVVFARRLLARSRYCATQGHTPFRAVSEMDEWECLYCHTPLQMSAEPQVVATSVAQAASEIELERHRQRPQSYYSDRR